MSSIYAVGDLHLPGGDNKPMDIFGSHWEGYYSKISSNWITNVKTNDIVLLPGDISWAMRLEDVRNDLESIGALPGRKIIIRGNHDYWWGAISRLREILPEGMFALQNDALLLDGTLFCGTRGWTLPADENDIVNKRIYTRELSRMELSLHCARKMDHDAPIVVLTHYPPVGECGAATPMSELLSRFEVRNVVYGHLHGASIRTAFNGISTSVDYHLVSCDGLNFSLYRLPVYADVKASVNADT